jgi:uncharacterized protein (UPF0548 family)
MIRVRRPTDAQLAELLARCRDDSLTYAPVGGSLTDETPAGLHRHSWSVSLPRDSFARAVDAIRSWAVHRGSGLSVAADGPIEVGRNVAFAAPLPLGFVDATCRIVAIVDEDDRAGFAYGTLSVHPERGEESFVIVRDDEGVRFDVNAVSRPGDPLARALPFLTDRLQDAAVRRYLDAISRIVESG